jgi:hypothetical protein
LFRRQPNMAPQEKGVSDHITKIALGRKNKSHSRVITVPNNLLCISK